MCIFKFFFLKNTFSLVIFVKVHYRINAIFFGTLKLVSCPINFFRLRYWINTIVHRGVINESHQTSEIYLSRRRIADISCSFSLILIFPFSITLIARAIIHFFFHCECANIWWYDALIRLAYSTFQFKINWNVLYV